MAEQVFLEDVNDLATYEIALEAQLAFNGVAEIMAPDFSPPVQVPNMDFAERSQYRKDFENWKKQEQKAFGIILGSLKKIPHLQRDLLALVELDSNGIRRGSTLLVTLRGLVYARQDTATLSLVGQKLDKLRLMGPTEAEFDTFHTLMVKYLDILEGHSRLSEQFKILKLERACNDVGDFSKKINIYLLLPGATFNSVCEKLRLYIHSQAALLFQDAQRSERAHADAMATRDIEKAQANFLSRGSSSYLKDDRHDAGSRRSTSPSPKRYRDASPHRRRSPHRSPSPFRGRSSDARSSAFDEYKSFDSNYPNRVRSREFTGEQSNSRVKFKLSRAGSPSPSREQDAQELDKPNLQCFKCKGFGHKGDVCPSSFKRKT